MNIALIPAYMPDKKMISLLSDLKAANFDIVVVDDGSGDKYRQVFDASKYYAHIIRHDVNKGKGAAIKSGLSYIMQQYEGDYVVVTIDADGQHKIDDVIKVCSSAKVNTDALVIGSRKRKGKIPFASRFGNALTSFVFLLATRKKVYDTQTGLRAFSNSLVMNMMMIEGDRYEYEMNVLMEMARKNVRILEIPIETVYIDGNSSSHFNKINDSISIYKEILKFSASSLIGFLVDFTLFSLLSLTSAGIIVANVLARIVSASVNFTLNRKFVFSSKDDIYKEAVKYILLAGFILCMNTVLLTAFVSIGINRIAAKLMTEIILFIFSMFAQKFFVFKKIKSNPSENPFLMFIDGRI